MHTNAKRISRLALSAVLGVVLTGGLCSLPAYADDTNKTREELNTDPMPLNYPFASPGSLHMFHWKDYTRTELKSGSALETRMQQQTELARQGQEEQRMIAFHRSQYNVTDRDQPELAMTDPAPADYPFAAPGSLHIYHWKDYTKTELEPGSPQDVRVENERKIAQQQEEEQRQILFHRSFFDLTDQEQRDQLMLDPAPVNYPFAAPASLNLYHWKDYSKTELLPGSATDARVENERKLEELRQKKINP